jgi:hypothetical protein
MCLSLLALGFTVSPATAAESRIQEFSLGCDGTERTIIFTATGLGNSVTRLVQGAEVSLTGVKSAGRLQRLRIQVAGTPTKTFLTLGSGEVSARNQFTGFFQVTTDATGNAVFEIIAACKSSKKPLEGIVVLSFF